MGFRNRRERQDQEFWDGQSQDFRRALFDDQIIHRKEISRCETQFGEEQINAVKAKGKFIAQFLSDQFPAKMGHFQ